jgi:hypothetical protein
MPSEGSGGVLEVIFAIFLGMMVGAFVGVGTYTFYPPPDAQFDAQIRDLTQQQQDFRSAGGLAQSTPENGPRLQALAEEIDRAQNDRRAARRVWGRNLSLILIGVSTLLMAISLIRADQLPVISDGLLIGGVFLMIYGIGWIVVTNTTMARFVVITVALALTLALGYLRFARNVPTLQARRGAGDAGLEQLEARVRALEDRMNSATGGPTRK